MIIIVLFGKIVSILYTSIYNIYNIYIYYIDI
jgi:hypothetical protein